MTGPNLTPQNVLNSCDQHCKILFRKLEGSTLKITALNNHLSFHETCLNNNSLPFYTIKYIYKVFPD